MKFVVMLLIGSALTTPALAETIGESTGVNSTLGIAPTTADFVREAAISDMFEIQSSKLATTRTTGPTKQFAEKMIADHTKVSSEMKPLAKTANAAVPDKLDDSHQKMIDKLSSLKGDDFAKEYHSDQDKGHKDAVSLFSRYAKGGENADLKSFAGSTLPTLQEHLKMAQDLDK